MLGDTLHFLDRPVHVDQGQHGHPEDPTVSAEAPVVLHPAVESLEVGTQRVRVGEAVLLDDDPHGGDSECSLHSLVVHEPQPCLTVEELRVLLGHEDPIEKGRVRNDRSDIVVPAEQTGNETGAGYEVLRYARRQEGGRLLPHRPNRPTTVGRSRRQRIIPVLRIDVPREAVICFVVVGVEIDRLTPDLGLSRVVRVAGTVHLGSPPEPLRNAHSHPVIVRIEKIQPYPRRKKNAWLRQLRDLPNPDKHGTSVRRSASSKEHSSS